MKIQQSAEQVSESKWKWSVWLEATDPELDQVSKVEYHLHPTFRNPIVERTSRENKFRLDSKGWGTFLLKAVVHLQDGTSTDLLHRLRFSRSQPKVFVSAQWQDNAVVSRIKDIMQNMQVGVTSAEDLAIGSDMALSIQDQIEEAKAVIVINGSSPNRSTMQEIAIARSFGKPIINIDPSPIHPRNQEVLTQQISTPEQLPDILSKLEE